MHLDRFIRLIPRSLAVAALLSITACGGGGGAGVVADSGGIIGGTGIKGPVSGATVTAYAVSSGAVGASIGTATTDASGNFSMSVGGYAGPVMLQLAGGTYTDEAAAITMPMASGDVMTAALPTVTAGSKISGVRITPLTSMAQAMAQQMAGGMSDANIAAANSSVGNYFMVSDILHVQPMNPLVAGSGSGMTQDAINYGMTLAAMSQYARGQGMTVSSAIVTAMMNDASDAMMDGMMGKSQVMMGGMGMGMNPAMPATAGTSGLASAMSTFVASAQNKSGVPMSTMQTLISRLNGSNGQLLGSTKTPSASGTVSGTVFNGPVSKATVSAYAINNGAAGALIASVSTDGQGTFTMPMGSYSGPVMLQVVGGVYADEATGTTMSMGASDIMSAVMPTMTSGANVSGIWITPITSMAQSRAIGMSGGMTDANIAAANSSVGNYFMVSDILHVQPMNPLVAGSGSGATQDARNSGAALAAMSQYAKDQNMPVSAAMVTAMMSDAYDGMMNGMRGNSPVSMSMGGMMGNRNMAASAGTSGLASAMAEFMSSAANASGLTAADMMVLMSQLNSSGGQLH